MEKDGDELAIGVGEFPPGLEVLADLPEIALQTAKNLGRSVVELLDFGSTATGVDQTVSHLLSA